MATEKTAQLFSAVQGGSVEKVRQLLEEGLDINVKMYHGWTALHSAVQGDHEELVHFLLDQGAEPCAKKDNGATPFIIAGITGNVKLLELFLSKGSEIDEHDDNGFTAFMETAWYGKEEALRFLYRRGAGVNLGRIVDEEKKALNKGGATALMDAARRGHFIIVKALVEEMGADVNICDNQDRNALVHALSVAKDHPWSQAKEEVALFLIQRGTDTTKRGDNGKTTLILAVEHQSQGLLKAILEKDEVDVDDADKCSQTALMIAVEKRDCNIARMLCEKNARTDIGGLIQLTKITYNNDMEKLLCQYGAKATLSPPGLRQMQCTFSSKRWGPELKDLSGMYRPMIGKLKFFMYEKFRIQRLSQGGVYLGFYDGEQVAVKVFPVGAENANREKTCLEKCRNSIHLVKYYGSEERKTCLYLCLTLCEQNLEEYFAENTNGKSSRDIIETIFQTVQELHDFEFGHQDLHPSNILIDAAGKFFLADFDKSRKLAGSDSEKNLIITEDLQALKKLVLYIAMRGQTRFEDLPTQCPKDIVDNIEIEDLRTCLGSPDERSPPSEQLRQLRQHPYFWSDQMKYRFLRDAGNEMRNTKEKNESTAILEALNTDEKELKGWQEKIDKDVLDCMFYPTKKKKHVYNNTVTDLLRFIRNIGEHLHEKDDWVKEILKKPEEYFLNRFPELTMHVYQTYRTANISRTPRFLLSCSRTSENWIPADKHMWLSLACLNFFKVPK